MVEFPSNEEMSRVIRERGSAEDIARLDMVEDALDQLEELSSPLGYIMATWPRWPCGQRKVIKRMQFAMAGVQEGFTEYRPCDCEECQSEKDATDAE